MCTEKSEKHWLKAPGALPPATTPPRSQAPLHLSMPFMAATKRSSRVILHRNVDLEWIGHRKDLKGTPMGMPSAPVLADPTGPPTCNSGSCHLVVVFCYEALASDYFRNRLWDTIGKLLFRNQKQKPLNQSNKILKLLYNKFKNIKGDILKKYFRMIYNQRCTDI